MDTRLRRIAEPASQIQSVFYALAVTGELLQHVQKGLKVDDSSVGACPQSFLESVAAETESVDHIVRIDDAHDFVRRQVAILVSILRS